MEALLQTKFYIPSPRPDLVARPHLIKCLNEGLARKLTLISAPAGFGKTTLVSSWVDQLAREQEISPVPLSSRTSVQVAWLSLDEGDNDPTRFLAYLVAALQKITANFGSGVLGLLQSPQPPPPESILTTLLNEIATIPDNFVLILDDYHLIAGQAIHQALDFLLNHLPPHIHLVIASRADPPLSLSRLRARGQMTELREDDLRFSVQEAATFLNELMGLHLTAAHVVALET